MITPSQSHTLQYYARALWRTTVIPIDFSFRAFPLNGLMSRGLAEIDHGGVAGGPQMGGSGAPFMPLLKFSEHSVLMRALELQPFALRARYFSHPGV